MHEIKAQVKYIERVKVPCPDDGVHVSGKDGAIKGVHSLWFDDRLVPKGSNGFFWETDDEWGLKVYYSFGRFECAKRKFVEYEKDNMRKLFKLDLAPETGEISTIKVDLYYKDLHIIKYPFCIKTKIVHCPQAAWEEYAKGHPYNWGAIQEDWHTTKGFLAFRDKAKKIIKKAGIKFEGSLKLGDILACEKTKRWYIVDGGR